MLKSKVNLYSIFEKDIFGKLYRCNRYKIFVKSTFLDLDLILRARLVVAISVNWVNDLAYGLITLNNYWLVSVFCFIDVACVLNKSNQKMCVACIINFTFMGKLIISCTLRRKHCIKIIILYFITCGDFYQNIIITFAHL